MKNLASEDGESTISIIKEKISSLTLCTLQLNILRRQLLNDFLDLKGNIRVFCRIRPAKQQNSLERSVTSDASNVFLRVDKNKSKSYSFDEVFHPDASQDEVFSEIEPVIKSVIDGYNACLFAYGQTGTGKTFTMEGTPASPGLVPRVIEGLLKASNDTFLISFSMLEIYLGNIKDLLVTQLTKSLDSASSCLSVRTDRKGGMEIENLVTVHVRDINQALKLYRLGCQLRSTASTDSNTTSSRSHCMIRMLLTSSNTHERCQETNKLWLVDLGGSERVMKTKACGRRLDEGKAINSSLSALADVIYGLQTKMAHVPYRNSKLTHILKDSLGGESKTLMLVHISSKEEDLRETICSLNYATRVKNTHLGHKASNEERCRKDAAMIDLRLRIQSVEDECQQVKKNIQELNGKLESLTTGTPSLEELQKDFRQSPEKRSDDLNSKVRHLLSARVPGFMSPTICSRRKPGTEKKPSGKGDRILARRRRPSSQSIISEENKHTFPQPSLQDTGFIIPGPQRTLYVGDTSEKDPAVPRVQSQRRLETKGMFYDLKHRVHVFCICALLGLGFHACGLDHDFFYGLTL